MNNKKEVPGIVLLASWILSLIVFAVGFWHTYLGLKEMKPFNSEYGALAVAAIVLLLLLITYWFAVNGNKTALIFYIACGLIFFVCNLNYFYPSYTARPLIQDEAKALNDTLQKYTNGSSVIKSDENSKAVSDYLNLLSLQDQIVTEISNLGYGPNAKNLTNQFNSISSVYSVQPISIGPAVGYVTSDPDLSKKQREDIEPLFNAAVGSLLLKGILKVADPNLFKKGQEDLAELNKQYTDTLNTIAADNDAVYNLDSIKQNKNVRHIVKFVAELNSIVDKLNKGNKGDSKNATLKMLDKDEYPRADKLGTIKHTITSIGERLNEIDTWAIIFLCLFIDLLVPLAIYLLLRKKGDEPKRPEVVGPIKF